jgi:TM2 domain-containing membrane protein YozV
VKRVKHAGREQEDPRSGLLDSPSDGDGLTPACPTGGGFMSEQRDTHLKSVGYILWIFGFLGSHRFYYGRPISGTIWFFTLGLLGIGWLIDLFLIPGMDRDADRRYRSGPLDYTVAWIFLTFLGYLGIHRFYLGKWPTAILYLLTLGLFGLGVLYDFWTLNEQVDAANTGA